MEGPYQRNVLSRAKHIKRALTIAIPERANHIKQGPCQHSSPEHATSRNKRKKITQAVEHAFSNHIKGGLTSTTLFLRANHTMKEKKSRLRKQWSTFPITLKKA
jgi:hypothetical protein